MISLVPLLVCAVRDPFTTQRPASMSDQCSSVNTSSGAASSLRTVTQPSRPAHTRDHSYTHIFPASTAGSTLTRKPASRKADDTRDFLQSQVRNENTRLLYGGLQWLLDTTAKSYEATKVRVAQKPSEPLSEQAITSLNAQGSLNADTSSEPAKTAAWIDGQRKSPAAPPF